MSKGALMTLKIRDWERPLLSLAYEAGQVYGPQPRAKVKDKKELDLAYDFCEAVTAVNSRSFFTASRLLPREKRRSVRALYAFCRKSDDIVDKPPIGRRDPDAVRDALAAWKASSLSHTADAKDPVALAWSDARRQHGIPHRYAEQLIQGVARDINEKRYKTFADLTSYCYGVAATVGLMSMHIIGFSGVEAIPYALKLGVALQLTNILRDVGEDWEDGRLYLPLEDLGRFGLDEMDISTGKVDDRWRAFMRFQIGRTRQLYDEAWPGIALLHADGRFAIGAAAELYRAILADIESHDYDVFSRRAHVNAWGKLRRLPSIWWRSKSLQGPEAY
ncbi:MAG: phytoene/squalene synthase family protein [Caldilineaceae bacterium]|nr:phytoene/squalene synthase family protein [Caldilineaceae bacterium]